MLWRGVWKQVDARPAGSWHDIVAELRSITNLDASLSVPMILDVIEYAGAARRRLSKIYDDSNLVDLQVYILGDDEVMSGCLST